MAEIDLNRRRLLGAGAAASALPMAPATSTYRRGFPWAEGEAAAPQPAPHGNYAWFTAPEAAFIEAATARLIPHDELGPGAIEAGVPQFIDRQLAGEFGRGGRWYMQGPWGAGLPTQGYQSRMGPAQLYRAAIRAIDQTVGRGQPGTAFHQLGPTDQDAFLHGLEGGQISLQGADGKTFFKMLLQNTLEGFWSDPIYGGNRDMVGWRLIGFPGARYDHSIYVARYGQAYPLPPVGLKGRPAWSRS